MAAGLPNSAICNISPGILSMVTARFDEMPTRFAALVWDRQLQAGSHVRVGRSEGGGAFRGGHGRGRGHGRGQGLRGTAAVGDRKWGPDYVRRISRRSD